MAARTSTPKSKIPDQFLYSPNADPRGDGPRCSRCGDLVAWGRHPRACIGASGEIETLGDWTATAASVALDA